MEDEIIYDAPLGPRVQAVQAQDKYTLRLKFTDGAEKLFDFSPLLDTPVFRPLKNKELFKCVCVKYGTVWWPGDIDYCPDCLYSSGTTIQ